MSEIESVNASIAANEETNTNKNISKSKKSKLPRVSVTDRVREKSEAGIKGSDNPTKRRRSTGSADKETSSPAAKMKRRSNIRSATNKGWSRSSKKVAAEKSSESEGDHINEDATLSSESKEILEKERAPISKSSEESMETNSRTKMTYTNITIRSSLLYEFKNQLKAKEAARKIRGAFGKNAVTDDSAKFWFHRFKTGNENLEDEPYQTPHSLF